MELRIKRKYKIHPRCIYAHFCSPVQEVLKHYWVQPSSQSSQIVFVNLTLLPSKQRGWFFRPKSPSVEAIGNSQAKSCCKIKTHHYLMTRFLQSFISTGSFSWLNYPCSVLRQNTKRANVKANPRNLSNSSVKGLSRPGTVCPGQWWSLHPGGI